VYEYSGWRENRVGGWTGVVLAVDNVDDAYQQLYERGVEFTEPPKREPWSVGALALIPKAT
jgi:uncharacterized glyoxalase superfamily protein PhnB